MCGFVGSIGQSTQIKTQAMLDRIKHRGPDASALQSVAGGIVGHNRLSIVDINGGHQPMRYRDLTVVFNGEIYNHKALREKYLKDYVQETDSDTEVLLHLFDKFGPDFVPLLVGMYTFAIIRSDGFFVARDPMGIKPLYCSTVGKEFHFASEIKALAMVSNDIKEFPAGHWYDSRLGWQCHYWLMDKKEIFTGTVDDAERQIRQQLDEAVRKRLMADVPVGISLSGGLDSSIIALHAASSAGHLHSFAVGMPGSEDLAAARVMADFLGTEHHEVLYSESDILEILPEVIYHLETFDPSLVRSAVPNYFLSQEASKFVKVILTGEGADELYAGYDYMGAYSDPGSLQREMEYTLTNLHNTNLQRTDRIPMRFGLEARVPFLDVNSIAFAAGIPASWKLHSAGEPKAILRNAYKDRLPHEIVHRPKAKFSKGAGSSTIIRDKAEATIDDAEFVTERARLLFEWNYTLQDKESLYYYQTLRTVFEDQWIFPTMGRSRSL